jgi:hypothetical protein
MPQQNPSKIPVILLKESLVHLKENLPMNCIYYGSAAIQKDARDYLVAELKKIRAEHK